jgi:hypothetical protein
MIVVIIGRRRKFICLLVGIVGFSGGLWQDWVSNILTERDNSIIILIITFIISARVNHQSFLRPRKVMVILNQLQMEVEKLENKYK